MTAELPERGPLHRYEVTWATGHVEHIDAHQVLMPQSLPMFGDRGPGRWTFHGEIDGRWTLLLTAPEDAIRFVRNVTHTRDEATPS